MSSFSIPSNVPSFSDPQRARENSTWAASGVTGRSTVPHSRGVFGGIQEYIGKNFEKNGSLPMYKDKPLDYKISKQQSSIWKRRALFGAVTLLLLIYLWSHFKNRHDHVRTDSEDKWSWLTKLEEEDSKVDWNERREKVKEVFTLSWDAYNRYGWGYDEYHPISKQGYQMTPNGMGWIIVDALDTLILMNLTSRLSHAREWISTKLDYEQNKDVSTFETTIRMLGGLLSAHYLSRQYPNLASLTDDDEGAAGEDLYLEKAIDLADRILGAFESPSGLPYASFNLKSSQGVPSHDDGGASSTAEVATLQLEFKYLAKLTGEELYWKTAEKVFQIIDENGSRDGLVPIFIDPNTGRFRGENIRLGSRGDSYYEYLIKQYLQTSNEEIIYKEMWDEALMGVRKHLITYSEPSKFTVLGERPHGLNGHLSPKMDHLVCFMPGTIALGATGGISEAAARKLPSWNSQKDKDMQLARELSLTCWGMYKIMATGLAPEIAYFNIDKPPLPESTIHKAPEGFIDTASEDWKKDFVVRSNDKHNLQRPETVESLFYMWRITGDLKYREWGWEIFRSFVEHTAVDGGVGGFTSLSNVDIIPPETKDNMESFWLAETLKYFYLLFSPNDFLPLEQVVFNTEAHPLPRFDQKPLFKTGWERKAKAPADQLNPENAPKLKPIETETLELNTPTDTLVS